ncbi:MAG: extracellular solute-binding protein [Clostridia bacterium]|nr:extracellular solute-binding protein [Clostridia bacterium]
MKRILSTLLLLAILTVTVLGTLTSCGGGGGGTGGGVSPDFEMPAGGFDTTTPVTITFYHSMGQGLREILDDAIADFNKIYPNIKVEHQSFGDYDGVRDQVKQEILVGDQPHLAYCYPDHVALYNDANAVQTLDIFMNDATYGYTEEQLKDFVAGWLAEGAAFGDDKMYSLPLSKSTEVLYYNKTYFEKNNLKVPTTWDEMEAVCRQIKEMEGDKCIPLGYDSESNWFITMCEQYNSPYTSATGENFLFDNETNRAFVERFRTWYQEKLVTTKALNSNSYTSNLFTGSATGNAAGTRSYMCIGSTGGTVYQQPKQTDGVYEFEVGVAQIPQIDPSKPKVISQGPSICLFKKDNPQEVLASWLFAKFLTTDINFQAGVSMNNGYCPVIKSVIENAEYKAWLDTAGTSNLQAYGVKAALEHADSYYASPAFLGSSIARDQVGLLLSKCLSETAAKDISAFIKKAFEDAVEECKYQSGQ